VKDLLFREQLIKCLRSLSWESLVKLSAHLRLGGWERISKASLLYSCQRHMALWTWLKSYPFVFGDRYLIIRNLTCCGWACPPEGPSTMTFFFTHNYFIFLHYILISLPLSLQPTHTYTNAKFQTSCLSLQDFKASFVPEQNNFNYTAC